MKCGNITNAVIQHKYITGEILAEQELTKYREHLEELIEARTQELGEKTEKLEEANVQLKDLDKLKSMFIASMSHELRTPLNSIIGFTGILLMGMAGELTKEQKKQLLFVKNSANHLLDLINDILDVSKIEAEKIDLSIASVDVSPLLAEIKDSFSSTIDIKGLSFKLVTPEHLLVESDRRRLKQVLMNIVGNALKFTDEGFVSVITRSMNDTVTISIKDTGIGIREADTKMLFQPFSRITHEGRIYEGTGLGLHLSQKLITLLGGDITCKSAYGKGTTFTITLPTTFEQERK